MEMDALGIVVRLALGLVIGFAIGMTGIGGGVLVLPGLTLVLRLPASVAVGTASLYAFLTKVYALYRHLRLKTVDLRLSAWLLVGAVPANAVAACWVNRCASCAGDNPAAFQAGLKNFIAFVVLFAAVVLVVNMLLGLRNRSDAEGTVLSRELAERPKLRTGVAVISGAVIGALLGLTSVGGGVLTVPVLILCFGLTPTRTVGSSIMMAVVLTLLTSAIFLVGSNMDVPSALIMAVGSLAGVYWGSKCSVKVPEKVLKGVIVIIVFIAAIGMMMGGETH